MAVNLYKHNEDAYNSALKMLNTKGKAAVIHPTGTGKSFIGFKLCENFPDKTVCWLSPSDYIFKTQLENLKKASGGYESQMLPRTDTSSVNGLCLSGQTTQKTIPLLPKKELLSLTESVCNGRV